MAYKQPYKNVKPNNDGASEPITALILGAAKLGKVIAGGVKAAKAAAATAKAAKASKLAAKAGKLAKSGKSAKATKVLAKSKKVGAKASQKMGKASNWAKRADKASKFADKVEAGTTKAQKAVTGVTDKVKGSKVGEKVGAKVDKFKEGYDKAAGKIADKTGFDKQNIKDFGTEKAQEGVEKAKEKISTLGQGGEEATPEINVNLSPAERKSPSGLVPEDAGNDSYTNPTGVSMFDHRKQYGPSIKSKYNNVNYGASYPDEKSIKLNTADGQDQQMKKTDDYSVFTSADANNVFKSNFGDTSIGNFSAPVTIKGVTFDAGDAIRLGILGYKGAKKGLEKHRLKERGGKKFKGERKLQKENKKAAMNYDTNKMKKHIKSLNDKAAESRYRKSLPKGTVANASVPNRDNKIKNKKINGKTYRVANSIDDLGMPEIPSLLKKRTS